MNFKLIVAVAVLIATTGCGGNQVNENQEIAPQKQETLTNVRFDFGFSVLCPVYFTATNSPNWHNYYYDHTNEIRVDIEDSSGNVKNSVSANSYYFQFEQESHKNMIQAGLNSGDYLRINCVHNSKGANSQIFSYRYHLNDKGPWTISDSTNNVNSVFFSISMIADLEEKMSKELIKTGRNLLDARQIARSQLRDDFRGAEYGLLPSTQFRSNASEAQALHSENTRNGRAYRRLKQLAEVYSGVAVGDVQHLNEFLARDFGIFQKNKAFTRPEISGAIFASLASEISEASTDFSNSSWKEKINVPNENFSYKTNILLDKSWHSELNWNQGKSNSEAYITKLQVVKFDPQLQFNKLFLTYDISQAFGGCMAGLFSCALGSGGAGVYVCFNSDIDVTLGCVVFASMTDLLKVNTLIGKLFDPNTFSNKGNNKLIPLSNSYNPSDSYGLERSVSLLDLINQINNPDLHLAVSSKRVKSLIIGATVFISSTECLNCKALLNIRKVGISKLQ